MDIENCEHEFIDNECVKCGLVDKNVFEGLKDTSNYTASKKTEKVSIIDSLDGIPADIVAKVKQNISRKQIATGKKVRNDKKNTFIQLYEAYLEKGYDFNPHIIAKKLKLTRKDINSCIRTISRTSLTPSVHEGVNQALSIIIIHPVAYVTERCALNNISAYEDEVRELVEKIVEKKDILLSNKPDYVCCAIIKKFCEKKHISTKTFVKVNDISDTGLKRNLTDIEEFF